MMARVEGGNDSGRRQGNSDGDVIQHRKHMQDICSLRKFQPVLAQRGNASRRTHGPGNNSKSKAFQKTVNDRNQQKVESCMNKFSVLSCLAGTPCTSLACQTLSPVPQLEG